MEGLEQVSGQLSQLLEVTESLSLRLSALEQGNLAGQVAIPTVSEAEASARIAEAEAAVKIAKVQAETQIETAKIYEEAETEREEIRAEAVEVAQEAAVAIAEETGETPTVIQDQSPGSQLPTTNLTEKRSILERLLLGR
jgi:hypothetical protein